MLDFARWREPGTFTNTLFRESIGQGMRLGLLLPLPRCHRGLFFGRAINDWVCGCPRAPEKGASSHVFNPMSKVTDSIIDSKSVV
jgi:hypothetical protein